MVPGINLLHDYLSIRIFEESETFLRSAVDFLASPVKIFTRQRSSKGNVFSRVCLSFCLFGGGGAGPCTGFRPSVQGLIGGFPTAFSVIIYHIGVVKINDMQITHSIV